MTAKPIALALGYDSYTVDGDTKSLVFGFDSPPDARAAFTQHLARARTRKNLAPVDATRVPDGPLAPHADRLQLDWRGARVRRAWLTARETHDPVPHRLASELLELALGQPIFDGVEEIGIGIQAWQDGDRAAFDPVLDVLAARRPRLSALALGDSPNCAGKLEQPARIGELYPALERLRLTCSTLPSLAGTAVPALTTLWLRGTTRDPAALAALDRPWPVLASLGVGWARADGPAATVDKWRWLLDGARTPALEYLALTGAAIHGPLVRELARSKLLPRLRTLELRGLDERADVEAALRDPAFGHLDVRIPDVTWSSRSRARPA